MVAAVDDGDGGGEAGEEEGFFHGAVAAADHGDVLVLEERAVAGGAVGQAVAGELVFSGYAEVAVAGAGGEDDGAGLVGLLVAVGEGLGLAGEVHGDDVVGDVGGAEAFGLLAHGVDEFGALDSCVQAFVCGQENYSAYRLLDRCVC